MTQCTMLLGKPKSPDWILPRLDTLVQKQTGDGSLGVGDNTWEVEGYKKSLETLSHAWRILESPRYNELDDKTRHCLDRCFRKLFDISGGPLISRNRPGLFWWSVESMYIGGWKPWMYSHQCHILAAEQASSKS
jgi:hypothetical protein